MTDAVVTNTPAISAEVPAVVDTAAIVADATPAEIRKMKLRVNEQDIELPEDEVIRLAQKGKYADQQMQTAAQARKQAEELIRMLKTNPMKALQHEALGLDVKKIISDYINEQAEEAQLTPEQKELRELRKMKADGEAEVERQTQAEQEKLVTQQAAIIQEQWETEITDALKTSGLPKTNYTVKQIAHYMKIAIEKGYKNVSPKTVLPLVREDFVRTQNDMYGQADEDTLASMLGDDLINKIVKTHLNKSKKANTPAGLQKPQVVKDSKSSQPEKKVMTRKEWLARFDK